MVSFRKLLPFVFGMVAGMQVRIVTELNQWWVLAFPAIGLVGGVILTNYAFPLLPVIKRVDTRDKRLNRTVQAYAEKMGVAPPRVYVYPSRIGPAAFTTGITIGRSVIFVRADVYASTQLKSSVAHEIRHLEQSDKHLLVLATLFPAALIGAAGVHSGLETVGVTGFASYALAVFTANVISILVYAIFAHCRRQAELEAYATMVAIDGPSLVIRMYTGPEDYGMFSQYPARNDLKEYISNPENITWS